MARISGVDLPRNKRIEVALTYIFGIGDTTAKHIVQRASIDPATRTDNLTEGDVAKLREIIERDYKVEGDLRREVSMNINRLMDLGCYRGLRHRKDCPSAGSEPTPTRAPRKGPRRLIKRPGR